MTPLRSVGFMAPQSAWLFGQARPGARRLAVLMLVVATLATAVAASAWWSGRSRLALVLQAQADAESGARRAAAPAPAASATALSASDRARINRVVRRLNTPWAAIFDALENEATPEVTVLSLESDAERGAVRVFTEGPVLDDLLGHAQRIQASPRFAQAQLLRIEPPEAGPDAAIAELSRLSFDLVLAP